MKYRFSLIALLFSFSCTVLFAQSHDIQKPMVYDMQPGQYSNYNKLYIESSGGCDYRNNPYCINYTQRNEISIYSKKKLNTYTSIFDREYFNTTENSGAVYLDSTFYNDTIIRPYLCLFSSPDSTQQQCGYFSFRPMASFFDEANYLHVVGYMYGNEYADQIGISGELYLKIRTKLVTADSAGTSQYKRVGDSLVQITLFNTPDPGKFTYHRNFYKILPVAGDKIVICYNQYPDNEETAAGEMHIIQLESTGTVTPVAVVPNQPYGYERAIYRTPERTYLYYPNTPDVTELDVNGLPVADSLLSEDYAAAIQRDKDIINGFTIFNENYAYDSTSTIYTIGPTGDKTDSVTVPFQFYINPNQNLSIPSIIKTAKKEYVLLWLEKGTEDFSFDLKTAVYDSAGLLIQSDILLPNAVSTYGYSGDNSFLYFSYVKVDSFRNIIAIYNFDDWECSVCMNKSFGTLCFNMDLLNLPTGIRQSKTKADIIHLFPNPSNGQFTVESKGQLPANSRLVIYATDGRELYNGLITAGQQTISTKSWSKGQYLFVVQKEEQVLQSGKIIVQ